MKCSNATVRIKVKNFGPINAGYLSNDGFIDFEKVTLFCGPQGSGKSTLAKLFSVFSWLEKASYRDPEIHVTEQMLREALSWQGILEYLRHDSEISYHGTCWHFDYAFGAIKGMEMVYDEKCPYIVPKIAYVPAERNISCVVRNAVDVQNLPRPLVDMQATFERAKRHYCHGYGLPVNGFCFEHDIAGNESWIVNDTGGVKSRVHIENASSGLQSIVPLLLVSDYLANHLAPETESRDERTGVYYEPGTAAEKLEIEEHIAKVMNAPLSDKVKKMRLEHYFSPGRRLVSIVEEPEQNLYPPTQRDVLRHLLKIVNSRAANMLVLSTHSPYLVNELVAASKVAHVKKLAGREESPAWKALRRLYPISSSLSQRDMVLYEITGKGTIKRLKTEGGVFSDSNRLNAELGGWNEFFGKLLSLEAKIHG